MIIDRFMHVMRNRPAALIVSAFIGLGLAAMFRRTCEGRTCKVYMPAPREEVEGKTFQSGSKCYQYVRHDSACGAPSSKP